MVDTNQVLDDDDLVIEIGAGVVEPGTYEATLTALDPKWIKVRNNQTYEDEDRQILEWLFATEDGGTVKGTTSTKTGPGSKLQEWVAALVPGTEPGARFTRRDLVGRQAMIEVSWQANGRFTHVVDVKPL